MIKLIYSPNYLDYDFGKNHPFWPERAKVFLEELAKSKLNYQLVKPDKARDRDILLVHSKEYLTQVKDLASKGGWLSIDTPLSRRVLEAAYWSVGGSIKASTLALKKDRAVNLLGGLHHAGVASGSGFCIFNDQAIAIKKLQQQRNLKKALIYDLDVHAGQGTQEIFYDDPTVYTVSLHQDPASLYPGTGFPEETGTGKGKGFNKNIILPPGTKEYEYLIALDSVLPIYRDFQPDLVGLVLGTDTYKADPLANLYLEQASYFKIGRRFARVKPLVVFFAGGYSKKTPQLWIEFLKGLTSE